MMVLFILVWIFVCIGAVLYRLSGWSKSAPKPLPPTSSDEVAFSSHAPTIPTLQGTTLNVLRWVVSLPVLGSLIARALHASAGLGQLYDYDFSGYEACLQSGMRNLRHEMNCLLIFGHRASLCDA